MSLRKDLVSIVIPAYNQPDYLRRALQSALEQRYRPLEVIVSDDSSPRPLEGVVREFAEAETEGFQIRFHRQAGNLGVMDNFRFTVGQARGKYLVPFAHDNWFTDPGFIADAVRVMESREGCHLCLANSVFENSDRRMLEFPDALSTEGDWTVLPGDEFIRLYRRGGLDWTQAIVLDHERALSLGAYDEPFMVNAPLARRLNSGEDNVCSYVFILSAVGSVAVSARCVCEIGTPAESYSRSDPSWIRTKKKVKFVVFYNLYRAKLTGPHASAVKRMAYRQALDYVDHMRDARILRYYGYDPGVLLLAALSLLRWPFIRLRYLFKRALGRNPLTGKPFKKMQR
ncbi:MAG TPA: glycosyltransferase family 2 protein [Desulfobacterales bacterium]|nr:glycosyltransferase family 2 protein [Desulfobacterales bacterium]